MCRSGQNDTGREVVWLQSYNYISPVIPYQIVSFSNVSTDHCPFFRIFNNLALSFDDTTA